MRFLLLLVVTLAAAADAPVLENTGKPLAIPFQCDGQQLDEAGLTCTPDDPCHVYLELTGIESAATRIFLTGNLHTRTATLSSIVLRSSDLGRTWTEPLERMPFTSLEGIQFIDFQRGWIAGEDMQTVPRDPFFLLTDDGGATWRRQPVFEDEEPGAVEGFWFDSRENGTLAIDSGTPGDRHQLYATTNGGAQWTLRKKSSAPLSIRSQAARDALSGWCYRADSHTRTWQIERHCGEHPVVVAEFLIELAVCRGE